MQDVGTENCTEMKVKENWCFIHKKIPDSKKEDIIRIIRFATTNISIKVKGNGKGKGVSVERLTSAEKQQQQQHCEEDCTF